MLRTWSATLYESESEQIPKLERSFLSLTVSADSSLSMRSATRGVPLSGFSTRSSNTRIALKGPSIAVNKAAAFPYCTYQKNPKEKWTTYNFIKNVYDVWMPIHLKRICSVVDELRPDIDFGLSQSASFLQNLDLQSSQQSNTESTSLLEEDDSQSSIVASQDITPDTSFSQRTEREYKKPKNNRTSEQQRQSNKSLTSS